MRTPNLSAKKNTKLVNYLRENRHEGGTSGFILPSGEWVPIRRQAHDGLITSALHHAGVSPPWHLLEYFRDTYGIIRVTYFPGMIAFDVPDGVTNKQIETAATRVVATAKDDEFIGWHKEPGREREGPEVEERERCLARVEKLAGRSRYPTRF